MKNFFLLAVTVTILASCSIDEKTTFNSNYGGKSITKMDLTAAMRMVAGIDPNAKKSMLKQIQKGVDSLKRANPQYKMDVQMDTASNILSITTDFKNLDEYNDINTKMKSGQQMNVATQKPASLYRWEKKGKVLIMPGLSDITEALNADPNAAAMLESLGAMPISFERIFPKKISNVSDNRIAIGKDNKTLTFTGNLKELIKNPLSEVKVTFK